MTNIDTRSAAQHRFMRHTKIVIKACIVASGCILAYMILNWGV